MWRRQSGQPSCQVHLYTDLHGPGKYQVLSESSMPRLNGQRGRSASCRPSPGKEPLSLPEDQSLVAELLHPHGGPHAYPQS